MGLFGKEHKKVAAEFVLETASDYHVAFGTTPAFYNEDREQIEPLPAAKYGLPVEFLPEDQIGH
jgi:hypothetical protein